MIAIEVGILQLSLPVSVWADRVDGETLFRHWPADQKEFTNCERYLWRSMSK
jgi:hypothetical protein